MNKKLLELGDLYAKRKPVMGGGPYTQNAETCYLTEHRIEVMGEVGIGMLGIVIITLILYPLLSLIKVLTCDWWALGAVAYCGVVAGMIVFASRHLHKTTGEKLKLMAEQWWPIRQRLTRVVDDWDKFPDVSADGLDALRDWFHQRGHEIAKEILYIEYREKNEAKRYKKYQDAKSDLTWLLEVLVFEGLLNKKGKKFKYIMFPIADETILPTFNSVIREFWEFKFVTAGNSIFA